jgi:DNA-directed RNA polymerase specialized sigma24 family protein
MSQTYPSLLARLRDPANGASWGCKADRHSPMILGWMGRHIHSPDDCQDLAREVLIVVVRRFPAFQHNQRPGTIGAEGLMDTMG